MPTKPHLPIAIICLTVSWPIYAESISTDLPKPLITDSVVRRHAQPIGERGFGEYSAYIDAALMKIERIGRFTPHFKSSSSPLSLVIDIGVNADGSLDSVEIVNSSGDANFDEWTIQLVNQAAPFAPFPDSMSKRTSLIHFTRAWSFGNNSGGWRKVK